MAKIVAKALVINKEGSFLFLYRGLTHPNFPGHLDLPGGEVEGTEIPSVAIKREIYEETSINIASEDIEKVFFKSYEHVEHLLYAVKLDEIMPTITLSWEHSGFEWISRQDLIARDVPSNADPYYLDVLEYLINYSD